jgi:hypothetical protein
VSQFQPQPVLAHPNSKPLVLPRVSLDSRHLRCKEPKNVPQTFQQFMTDALAEAGLTDEQVTSALGKLYAHDKLSPKLNAIVKTATDDYQAQVGRVRSLEDRDKTRDTEMNAYYARVNAEHAKVVKELNELKAGGVPNFDESKYVSKEDLQATMGEMGNRFASVLKDATSITAAHVARFGEAPDLEAIEKIAADSHLPIRAAYDKYIEPRVKEAEVAARKKWEADTRAEMERDIRSQNRLPVDARPAETAPVYRSKSNEAPKDMDSELLAAWHGTEKK